MSYNFFCTLGVMTMMSTASFADAQKPQTQIIQNEQDEGIAALESARTIVQDVSNNNSTTLKAFDALAEKLIKAYRDERKISSKELEKIAAAIEFAADVHKNETRKNKEKTPYISHPIGVTYHLMEIGEVRSSSVIMAAILHDTMEGGKVSFDELKASFGKESATIVQEVTDVKGMTLSQKRLFEIVQAANKSKEAAQIKLADHLYNLYDLSDNPPQDWSPERVKAYYQWAQVMIDRLPVCNDKLKKAVQTLIDKHQKD